MHASMNLVYDSKFLEFRPSEWLPYYIRVSLLYSDCIVGILISEDRYRLVKLE